jgi:hypothetical protein
MSKNQPTLSAAPGGTALAQPTDAVTKSDTATAPGTSPSSTITARIDRLKLWHTGAKASATRLKLFVFLAGAEITCLKSDLGITQGRTSDIMSEVGESVKWITHLEQQSGITERTIRRYCMGYFNMSKAAPDLAQRILTAADITLALDDSRPMALQLQIEESIKRIPTEDIEAFCEALDPWNLSELYQRPLKAAQVETLNAEAKAASKKRDDDHQLVFWFGELDTRIRRSEHLQLPRDQRVILLEAFETAVRELRESLKGSARVPRAVAGVSPGTSK